MLYARVIDFQGLDESMICDSCQMIPVGTNRLVVEH